MVSLPIVNVIRVSIGGPKGRRGGLGFGGGAGTDVDEWDPQSAEPRAAAANANYKFAPAPKKTPAAPGAKKGTRRRIANDDTVFIVLTPTSRIYLISQSWRRTTTRVRSIDTYCSLLIST